MDVKYLRRCEKAKSKIKTNGFEYRKIPKVRPEAFFRGLFLEELIFGGAYLRRPEGNLRFKIDRASLIVEGEFTLFCFVLLCI